MVEEDPDQPGYFMRRGMSRIGARQDMSAEGIVASAPMLIDIMPVDIQAAICNAAWADHVGDDARANDFRDAAGY